MDGAQSLCHVYYRVFIGVNSTAVSFWYMCLQITGIVFKRLPLKNVTGWHKWAVTVLHLPARLKETQFCFCRSVGCKPPMKRTRNSHLQSWDQSWCLTFASSYNYPSKNITDPGSFCTLSLLNWALSQSETPLIYKNVKGTGKQAGLSLWKCIYSVVSQTATSSIWGGIENF